MENEKVEKEYLMLREEIIHYYSIIQNSRNILYVAIAALLAFGVSSNEPLLCLIPYCVIIPIYIVTIDYQYGMWRIGTYLSVFLEGDEFNWETRLHKLNSSVKMNRYATSYNWPFIITSLVCTGLFFLKTDYSTIDYKLIAEVIFAVLLTGLFLMFVIVQKDPDDIKRVYLEKWNNIKNS